MSELIYIAAPYSHPNKDEVQARMEEIYITMGMFIEAGKHVITPLAMHEVVIRHDMEADYNYWEQYCLNILKRCDRLVVIKLEGWDSSRGVSEEIKFAIANNILVDLVEPRCIL